MALSLDLVFLYTVVLYCILVFQLPNNLGNVYIPDLLYYNVLNEFRTYYCSCQVLAFATVNLVNLNFPW